MSISTRNLSALPSAQNLEWTMRSLAMLDAILGAQPNDREFSFHSKWNSSQNERLGVIQNCLGDHLYLLFSPFGTILKGFAADSVLSPGSQPGYIVWPGVLENVPDVFSSFLNTPEVKADETTFCIWETQANTSWQHGPVFFPPGKDPDGSEFLMWALDGQVTTYLEYFWDYCGIELPQAAVESIFDHNPLTIQLIKSMNPDKNIADAATEARKIGYPTIIRPNVKEAISYPEIKEVRGTSPM